MKPFLGIDLTENRKNDQINGEEFLVAKPSAALTQSFEQSSKRAEDTIKLSKLPLPLRIIQLICGGFGAIFAVSLIRALGSISLDQAYKNAPWVFWCCGVCLLIYGILKLASTQKEKTVLGTDESAQTLSNLEKMSNVIYSELSVPSNARAVDLLCFFYKVQGDRIKVCEKGLQAAPYFNPEFKAFADNENLYIANLEGKYAFALSSLISIHTVKKHIRITSWNKSKGFNEGIFKQYKLTRDNMGCIHCKYYHIIEVQHNNRTYGIYIPCYELPVFEQLTGLKAQ